MLAPLVKLADETGIAVIGIKHFNKDSDKTAMHRSSGSIAYMAIARSGWVFVPDPKDGSRILMLMVKSNLGPKVDGLAFKVTKREGVLGARIEWLGPTKVSAEDALRGKRGPKGEKLGSAKRFLKHLLLDSGSGSMPSKEVKRLAKEEAISAKTVWWAKEELNLRAAKDNRGWVWILPADDDEG